MQQIWTDLQMLEGQGELSVKASASTAPRAPPLCHRRPLVRLQLQLAVQLHLQPLRLQT
jgi:hypothetical protein